MIPNHFPSDQRTYLRDELGLRQNRNPHYSLRAFARDLEMSPSFLCEFLAGRQGLSRERVRAISRHIRLSDQQWEHFWDLVESKFGRTSEAKSAAAFRVSQRVKSPENHLSRERFYLIADWYHFVLLEVLGIEGKSYSKDELAQILGITKAEVAAGLKRLTLLKLIEPVGKGSQVAYKVLTESTIAGGEGADRAVQLSHQQWLEMQADAVERKSFEERENISASFSMSQSEWMEFRQELQKSTLNLLSKYGSTKKPRDQVVCFSLQCITLLPKNEELKETPCSDQN